MRMFKVGDKVVFRPTEKTYIMPRYTRVECAGKEYKGAIVDISDHGTLTAYFADVGEWLFNRKGEFCSKESEGQVLFLKENDMKDIFEEGDEVIIKGTIKIKEENSEYPIVVCDNGISIQSFTKEGRYLKESEKPCLFISRKASEARKDEIKKEIERLTKELEELE
jgi:hypothetical protein